MKSLQPLVSVMDDCEVPVYVLSFAMAVEQRARRAAHDLDPGVETVAADLYTTTWDLLAAVLLELRLPCPTAQPLAYTHHDGEFLDSAASFAVTLDELAWRAIETGRVRLAAIARYVSDLAYALTDTIATRLPKI